VRGSSKTKESKMRMFMVMGALVLALFGAGCATTGGSTGETSNKVWTYNLQMSLARSGGDVAMTMALDQGVDKVDAVRLCDALIAFLKGGDVTVAAFNAKVADLTAKSPQFGKFVNKLNSAVPLGLGKAEQIPPEVKDVLLSFLEDGAVYGAGKYKDGMKLKMVKANEAVKP